MAREPSPEIDDELFNEVYGKEYAPPGSTANHASGKANSHKRPCTNDESDEENRLQDPNAVPTDFTSREAKVWEAKAKAIERNWKKRKEEEMICKICGESGHFTQGCPSTLGANRKSADFFERVAARDKHVRALFSEKVIRQIEMDVGCKIKMDEKFLIVSGKDRLILTKGVDAVHKVIEEDKGKTEGPTSSHKSRSRTPDRSPIGSHVRRSESQKSHSSPRNTSRIPSRNYNHGTVVEDRVRQDQRNFSKGSLQAYANDGAKGPSARSRSPPRSNVAGDTFGLYGRKDNTGKTSGWDVEGRGADFHSEHKFDIPVHQHTLEQLELDFKRETTELARIRDQEEDEENYKHRECIRELRENYTRKLAIMRGMHTRQREEFLQLDIQRLQQARHNAYNQPGYPDYEQSSMNAQYVASGLHMDARSRYPYPGESYPSSRPHDTYGEFQNQRNDDFRRAYRRY